MGIISGEVVQREVAGGIGWSMCQNEKVLCLGMEGDLIIYDLASLQVMKKIETRSDPQRTLRMVEHKGENIAKPEENNSITEEKIKTRIKSSLQESADNMPYSVDRRHDGEVIRRCEFMGKSDILGVGYFSGVCDIINTSTGEALDRLEGDDTEVKSVAFSECGRFGFSTRQGSLWVWALNDEATWEIEEIIEYSENDVKSILWHKNSLISVGYSNEIVVYSRWEDDICDVKWEIQNIFKADACVWDIAVVDGDTSYMAAVTQSGLLKILTKSGEAAWEEASEHKVSEYPIISVCSGVADGKACFAMIVDRRRLALYAMDGSLIEETLLLTEYDEPVDILFSKETSSFIVLSYQIKYQMKSSIIRCVKV
ncbi:cytosolic iron-sulfur protein assembly protein CIAO1 [Nematocida ausubeli]|nr:cytosolic iron-sulfur protein assembly protein CIAO1 [Nematocida ausubeli]